MNTEDKNLLVVDLLGRAPYNVVVNVNGIKGCITVPKNSNKTYV